MPCKAALGPHHDAKCLPRSLSKPLEQLEEKSAFWGLPPPDPTAPSSTSAP